MADNKIYIKVKEDPIIIKMAKQGMIGRTGPQGMKGDDGITWELVLTMTDSPDGVCGMYLYKDGVLCGSETHYAFVQLMYHGDSSFISSNEYSSNFNGTYSFEYENVRAIFVTVFEDSFMEKILCANSVNYGKAATITIGNVQQGAVAAVENVGTPTDAELDFVLPKGDAATVAVGTTTTLPAGSAATVENIGTENDAVFNFGIPNGGGSGARVEDHNLILDAGAIFIPSVSDAGVLSWTNNAQLDNPEPVNLLSAFTDMTFGIDESTGYLYYEVIT